MVLTPPAATLAADLPARVDQLADLVQETAANLRELIPPLVPGGLPDFVPNLLLTFLMAAIVAGAMCVPMKTPWPRLALWLGAILLPLAYTWTASAGAGTPGCTVGSLPWDVLKPGPSREIFYNIELLIPAGAAAFLWPAGPRRAAALICAIALPPMIEFGQLMFPGLYRACQLGDIVNNELGVIIGWCAAAGVVAAWRSFVPVVQPRHAPGAHPGRSSRRRRPQTPIVTQPQQPGPSGTGQSGSPMHGAGAQSHDGRPAARFRA